MKKLTAIAITLTAIGVAVKVVKKPQVELSINGKSFVNHLKSHG